MANLMIRHGGPRFLSFLLAMLVGYCLNTSPANAEEWPVWRGPSGKNIASPGQNLPNRMGPDENVIWKVRLQGQGHSSPVIFGGRIFLTTADVSKKTQSVLCLREKDGQVLWSTVVNTGGFAPIHKANTYASSTIACNGTELFALFENHDRMQLVKLSLDGKVLKQITAAPYLPQKYRFGIGLSPLLYQSLVIVASEFEEGKLIAFDQKTLKTVWQIPREKTSYSSPIVARIENRDQLLLSGGDEVQAFDPLTGKNLWSVPGATAATCGTLVWEGNLVFASGGFPGADTLAVKIDGTKATVLWNQKERCYEQSLLVSNGYLYAVNDTGIAFCWRTSDGEQMWKTRLCGPTSASPILADGIIYQIDERGKFVAFRDNPQKFEEVFQTKLGDSGYATPTVCNRRMYVRVAEQIDDERVETLYCFGKP